MSAGVQTPMRRRSMPSRWTGQCVRVCQSPVEPDQQGHLSSTEAESSCGVGDSNLAKPPMVPSTAGNVSEGTSSPATLAQLDPADTQCQQTGHKPASSRLQHLRRKHAVRSVSEEASDLLLAAWGEKSNKTYDSLFRKWMCWCGERDYDPFSSDAATVDNFLASLFKEGYQYRSINNYRSTISSAHDKIE